MNELGGWRRRAGKTNKNQTHWRWRTVSWSVTDARYLISVSL